MSAAKAKAGRKAEPDLLILAFDLIADTGWQGFSFIELADRAGLPTTEIRKAFSGREAVLDQLSERLDQAMLAFDPADMEGLPPRDRIFELVMGRLEAMAPFRAGLLRLMRDARFDPILLAMTACRLDRSLAWLQDAAKLEGKPDGSLAAMVRSRVQRRLLGAVYLQTLNVWASDESADLAKTMASLDKQLRRIEGFAGLSEGEKATKAA